MRNRRRTRIVVVIVYLHRPSVTGSARTNLKHDFSGTSSTRAPSIGYDTFVYYYLFFFVYVDDDNIVVAFDGVYKHIIVFTRSASAPRVLWKIVCAYLRAPKEFHFLRAYNVKTTIICALIIWPSNTIIFFPPNRTAIRVPEQCARRRTILVYNNNSPTEIIKEKWICHMKEKKPTEFNYAYG